jgi:DNA-binding NarL/FixJ family response regulator
MQADAAIRRNMPTRGTPLIEDKNDAGPAERRAHAIRVLLASPEAAERLGLATIITAQTDLELVAQTALAEETSQLLDAHRPDVAVIDAGLLEPCVVGRLLGGAGEHRPRLLVLVMHLKSDGVRRALQARAQGILLRGMNYLDFLQAIRTVHGGNLYSPEMAAAREGESDESV